MNKYEQVIHYKMYVLVLYTIIQNYTQVCIHISDFYCDCI